MADSPIRVTVTGAAGQIGYAILPLIAGGEVFGPDQPIALQLLEIEPALDALEGVRMELEDCAFPLLHDIRCTSDPNVAFENASACFLIGAKPRGKGQVRADLLKENAPIFRTQGRAIAEAANPDVRVLVVGNPANTNCLIAASHADGIDPRQFTAMTRLDLNRGKSLLARHTDHRVADVERLVIWGNHSKTMLPDPSNARIGGQPAMEFLDESWLTDTFIPTIQGRGSAIIEARGKSSAMSAARAAVDHMRDWMRGTGNWVSMAVRSDGHYDLPDGLYFSLPVMCENRDYEVVEGLERDAWTRSYFQATVEELQSERDAVADLLG